MCIVSEIVWDPLLFCAKLQVSPEIAPNLRLNFKYLTFKLIQVRSTLLQKSY